MASGHRRNGDVPVVGYPPPGFTRSAGCHSDRGPAAGEGQTVLADDRNGRRLQLNATCHGNVQCVCVCLIQVVERTTKARAARRHEKIQEYFYGLGERLYPHIFDVRFSDVHIYKVGGSVFVYFKYQYCVLY